MSEPDPGLVLWNLMRGAMAARALAVAADAGVADALAGGPRPVDDVARETGSDADTLRRVLRALATEGVFAEEAPGVFRNTPASERLRSDAPTGSRAFAHLFGGVFYRAIGDLDAAARAATFRRTFGTDFWSWLAEHPDEGAIFNRAMAGGREGKVSRLLELDWRDGETVVDVGGGNGALLIELLTRCPGLRGVVFDLEETAREAEAAVTSSPVADRCTVVAGSFFDGVPPGDAYVLSAIIHDWDDEPAAMILRNVRAAARPGARVIVRDAVIPPGNEPHGNKWLDLLMLVIGGRERDEREWRALLDAAGLEPIGIEDGLVQARVR